MKYLLGLTVAAALCSAAPAAASVIVDFNDYTVAPGESISVGDSLTFGNYRLTAVTFTGPGQYQQCQGDGCLMVGSSGYGGIDSADGNFLFLGSPAYALRIEDLSSGVVVIRSFDAAAFQGFNGDSSFILVGDEFNNGFGSGTLESGTGMLTFGHAIPFRPVSSVFLTRAGTCYPSHCVTVTPAYGRFVLSNSVPEPSTWAMLLLGFGLIGAAVRRSNRQEPSSSQGYLVGAGGRA